MYSYVLNFNFLTSSKGKKTHAEFKSQQKLEIKHDSPNFFAPECLYQSYLALLLPKLNDFGLYHM